MKLRRLIRYSVGKRSTNPGAAGAPMMDCINSEEVLQVFNDTTAGWEDVPVVYDEDSKEQAQRDKYRRK